MSDTIETTRPVDLTAKYTGEICKYSCDTPKPSWFDEWGWIADRARNDNLPDIDKGDYIPLRIKRSDGGDYVFHMEILRIGLYNDEDYTWHRYIDFVSKELLPFKQAWDDVTNTNCGWTQSCPIPWRDHCQINNYLNTEIYNQLDDHIKRVIIDKNDEVEVKYFIRIPENIKYSAKMYCDGTAKINLGKLWLPDFYETFGWGGGVYFLTEESRIKTCWGEDKPSAWPTRTITINSFDEIVGVSADGRKCNIPVNIKVGFPICFRVG